MLREDPETRTLVSRSLGRFEAGLGGVEAALSHARRGSLEDAFRVPGAPWISLSRFGWPKYDRLRELVPVGGVVLDLGCGFGPSLAPFLSPAKGGAGIGLDENLLFLLLFKRFAAERELREPVLVCRDAGRAPLPLADAAADVVIGASFFNHFACLRPRRKLRHFFAEAARVTAPGGTLILDMVPNRHRPFPTEVNVGEVIHGPALRRRAERLLRRLPTRWLPGPITAAALWVSYRLYMALARRRALGLTAFKRELGKAVPEAALSGLPYRLRQYARLAAGFSAVELLDDRRLLERRERVPVTGFSPRIGYLVLRARR